MSEPIVAKPTPVGSAIGILAGLVATVVTIGFSAPAAASGLIGLLVLLLGLVLTRPGLITIGSTMLGIGVILSGVDGATAPGVGVGFVGVVLAWDVSHNAMSHGRQVGRDASTASAETIHACGSLLVGLIAISVGYAIFSVVGAGQPATAVALLTLGAVVLVLSVK